MMTQESGYPPGHGEWFQRCTQCGGACTWYDIKEDKP